MSFGGSAPLRQSKTKRANRKLKQDQNQPNRNANDERSHHGEGHFLIVPGTIGL